MNAGMVSVARGVSARLITGSGTLMDVIASLHEQRRNGERLRRRDFLAFFFYGQKAWRVGKRVQLEEELGGSKLRYAQAHTHGSVGKRAHSHGEEAAHIASCSQTHPGT